MFICSFALMVGMDNNFQPVLSSSTKIAHEIRTGPHLNTEMPAGAAGE